MVGVAGEGEVEAGAVLEPGGVEVSGVSAVEAFEGVPCQVVGYIGGDCFGHAVGHGVEEAKFDAHISGIHIGVEVGEIDIALKLRAKFFESFFHAHHGEALPIGCDAFGFRV